MFILFSLFDFVLNLLIYILYKKILVYLDDQTLFNFNSRFLLLIIRSWVFRETRVTRGELLEGVCLATKRRESSRWPDKHHRQSSAPSRSALSVDAVETKSTAH